MLKRISATLGLVLALTPAAIEAQAACVIDYGKPGQVKDAYNALAKASLFVNKPEQAASAVKEAVVKVQKDEAKVIQQNPVGRAMVLAMVLNAVIHERVGTISQAVFSLPVLRILPRKSPWIRRFFDLDTDA